MMSQSRFENFSDGLIAIVITLLAFEMTIPTLTAGSISLSLSSLLQVIPHLSLYILSFITIAIMWENHHVIASRIERINQKIFWANSFLLMFMALVPFATSLVGKNPTNVFALVVYCFIMLCISLSFSQFRKHVYHSISKGDEKLKAPRHVGVYVYTFAIFTAFFSIPLAYLLLAIPLIFYIFPQQMGK